LVIRQLRIEDRALSGYLSEIFIIYGLAHYR